MISKIETTMSLYSIGTKYHHPHILLRSLDRVNGTSDNFTLNLNRNEMIGHYYIKAIMIPNSIYGIRSTNNTIYFSQSSTQYTATMNQGAYSTSSITTEVARAMNAAGATGTFSATWSSTTGLINITNSTTAFSLQFGSYTNNSAAYPLGFTSSNTTSATSQTATNVLQITPVSVTILISGSGNLYNHANQTRLGVYVPMNVSFGSVNYFFPNQEFKQILAFDTTQNSLNIQVFDSANNALSLNGADFEILLERCQE